MLNKHMHAFLLSSLLLLGAVAALAGPTGAIKGTVKDAKTGKPLPGANILIVGTSLGAASDLHGRYHIPSVPPGRYTIRVTFIGYKTVETPVKVQAGQTVVRDFRLQYVTLKGKAVTITAQAEGQAAAINQQLTAKAIVNVVSSARIQEIPDDNAAESVGRLPAVSVLRSGGEGTKVVIRGLAPKYNRIEIDGVKMASTDYGDRSVDLSMISPYMLEGIEVVKAVTPDMDADALGGTVNFKLKTASEGLHYDVVAQGGYNSLKNTYDDYRVVGNVSNRFLGNRLGVFAQFNAERRNRSANEMGGEYELNSPSLDKKNDVFIYGLTLTDVDRVKKRLGGTLVLDYRLPAGSVVLSNFLSHGNSSAQFRGESFGIPLSTHHYNTRDAETQLTVLVNSMKLAKDLPLLHLDLMLAHSFSEHRTPKNLSFTFEELNAIRSFDPRLPPTKLPEYAVNDLDRTVLSDIYRSTGQSSDREYTAALDLSKSLSPWKGISTQLKFGGKYTRKHREYDYDSHGGFLNYGSGQTARDAILNAFPWMKETVPNGSLNLPYPLFIDHDYHPKEFLKGRYPTWPAADIGLMYKIVDILEDLGNTEAYRHLDMSSTLYDYSGNEYYRAGYIMGDLRFANLLRVITGARYEQVTRKYKAVRGNSTIGRPEFKYSHSDTLTQVTNSNWLPMFLIKVMPFPWCDIRFAYTNTLSRPDFTRIIPRMNIGRESVTQKNYELKPSHSENFDLYLSFHENALGLLTVGAFKKNIEDMIFAVNGRVILDPSEYGLPASEKGKRLYTDVNNQYPVRLWGIEASWQTNFWYLPGALRGLVLDVNYTHIYSEVKYPRSIVYSQFINEPPWIVQTVVDTFYTARMLYQPNNIANLSLGYDYKGFSIRLSLLYQSDIFKAANFWPELRETTDDYLRWDLSVKQKLPWKGLQLYLNVRNLTGTVDRDLVMGSSYPSSEQYYGKGVDVGLRYRVR